MQVSNNSLCTVMDECRGGDLECLLQRRGALPEDEARCILRQVVPGSRGLALDQLAVIRWVCVCACVCVCVCVCVFICIYIHMYAQVLSGLSYLASLQHSVIHYDLKPANIMLTTRNEVRLTDVALAAECT